MTVWIAIVGAAWLLSGAIVAHAVIVAPTDPDWSGPEFVGRAAALTFDQHAVASALLQPDLPQLTDTPHADALEDWLRTYNHRES